MKEIVFATGNVHKVKEIERMFDGLNAKLIGLKDIGFDQDIVEDGDTFEENSYIKAKTVHDYILNNGMNYAVLAEDSGLCCPALGGAPGIYSARYAGDHDKEKNRAKLLHELADKSDRSAYYMCVATYIDVDGSVVTGEGKVEGHILTEMTGDNGFAYDPIFYCDEIGKSFGIATLEEKNAVSHRYRAIVDLQKKLNLTQDSQE